MKVAPTPLDEIERLSRLKSYEILDTEQELKFDNITQAVAKLCGVKIALISLIDQDRQWFKSRYGLDAKETPRDISFCGHAIMGNDIFVVENAKKDERFCDNPLVLGGPQIAFYAGMPLITSDNYKIGTLCVIDAQTQKLSALQIEVLKTFAQNVVELFELHAKNKSLRLLGAQYLDVQNMVQAGSWELDVATGITQGSKQIYEIFGIPQGEHNLGDGISYYAPDERDKITQLINECITNHVPFADVFEFFDAKGRRKWVRSMGRPQLNQENKVTKVIGTFQDVTAQVEKEKMVSLVLENISEGYFDWNLKTNEEFISPQFWHLLGYDPKTKAHHPDEWRKILHPDDIPLIKKAHELHFSSQGKIPYDIEVRMQHFGGHYLWLRVSGKVIEWDQAGSPMRMVGSGREIQKEKELIEKISETNKYLDLAVEGANFGIWDWDLRDNRVKFSPRWAELRGAKIEELKMDLGDWESRVHPDDLKDAYEAINLYLSGKTIYYEHLHRVKHKNGRWIYILGRGRFSSWDDAGKPTRFTGTDMDITELMTNKLKMDLFFQKAPYGIAYCDMSGKFLEVNDEFTKITGYNRDELNTLSYWELTPAVYKEQEAIQIQQLTEKGSYGPYRKEYIKKSGELVPVKLSGFVIEDHTGEKGIWSVVENTSAKVKLEHERDELMAEYQKANEKLQAIFDFSPVVVYECAINDNWTMSFLNPYISQISGYTEDELVHDCKIDFGSLIHKDDRENVSKAVMEAVSTEESFNIYYRILHKDGSVRWIWDRGAKVPKTQSLIGVLIDVTEEKLSEDKLLKLSNELNQFFSLSLNYLCIARPDGYFNKINSTWLNLGYSEAELTSRPFIDYVHPNDLADTLAQLTKVSKGNTTIGFENRYLKKNGEYLQLEWASALDPHSGLIYAAATDVTERKKREDITQILSDVRLHFIESASSKKDFFGYLLEKIISLTSSEYGFIGEILDNGNGKGKYLKTYALTDISWSEETRKFFEAHNAEGLEFKNLDTLFGEVIKTGELLIANDAPHHPKASGIPQGHPPLDTFMGVPIRYNGVMFAMIGVANNKAGYKKADYNFLVPFFELVGEMIQNLKLNDELEKQRQLSLHNAKLASIGELAAGVGHEINNPLAIILGQIEVLKMRLEDKNILEESLLSHFSKMTKGVDRISNIVKGLKTFARMDKDLSEVFNLKDLIVETIGMMIEIYRNDGITFHNNLEEEIYVTGISGRIQQVIVNLLNNARDAMLTSPSKTITLNASFVKNTVMLRITDSGSGIDKSLRAKIFEPFFTTKDVNKGTGIGLSLALSIIRDHQGNLEIEKTSESGTTFLITLPSTQRPINIAPPSTLSTTKSASSPIPHLGTVLVVDDETDIRELLVYFLSRYDLKILSAANGAEALKIYGENKNDINLIISDMKMPQLTGEELAQELRHKHHYKGGFFLITGGVNFPNDKKPDEINGIISKPFSTHQFTEILQLWCPAFSLKK